MQRDVELSGGPLSGAHWPVRLEADHTLWIGIGADGSEYDGRSRLNAIAIYERAGSDESPRFDFARLEGPGARIAELGRRITRLRADWAEQRKVAKQSTPAETSTSRPAVSGRSSAILPDNTQAIAARVFERWRHAVEAAPSSSDKTVRVHVMVPGEAEQLQDLLERHRIPAQLVRTSVEFRTSDSETPQTLETGAVEIRVEDVERVTQLLQGMVASPPTA